MISKIKSLFVRRAVAPAVLYPQLDAYLTAQYIGKAIRARSPFLASRLGFAEARCLSQPGGIEEPSDFVMEIIWRHAGVFPAEKSQFKAFGETYLSALGQVDLLGLIGNAAEKNLVDAHAGSVATCDLGSLEPYLHPFSWSQYLQGLKVLVVHPFVESIKRQYAEHRTEIFLNPDVLPEFELRLLRAPQTLAGNNDGYKSWTDAYNRTAEMISNADFDVAILGCGAYGLPLAALVKKSGKVAIHLGGATQLLFGISGKRWIEKAAFRVIMTHVWRPPLDVERPQGLEKVEEGCYW
jgi:hypothetical protein